MSSLADSRTVTACCERITMLTPDSKRRWGRMTGHQMVCHLNDSFLVVMGEKFASPASNLFTRTVMKWGALRTPVPWPHGAPTRPEIEQGRGGTPPADWERDCAQLHALIVRFAGCESFTAHPFFGDMSRRDWMVWGYRHVDHHFRQFGI